jgi:hypothetical protein
MKQATYFFLLPLLILGCKGSSEKKPVVTIVKADSSKIECVPTQYTWGYNDNFDPGTFDKTTFVYNSIKADAKIIDNLPFNSSVNILKEYPEFFMVCTPKAKSGFIKKTDLYFHSVFWGYKSCTYLFGIDKYPKQRNTNTGSFPMCDASGLKVLKLSPSKKILDVFRDSIQGTHYELKLIFNSALKNADAVFHLHYDCYNEIGITTDHFIVDNGKKLSRLLITGGAGDGGESSESLTYLPVKLTNSNKIVLAKNGIISVNEQTAKVEIYPYPEDCGVPINELVIVVDKSTELVADDSGDQKHNRDGTVTQKTSVTKTTYYRWDGNTLQEVKFIK